MQRLGESPSVGIYGGNGGNGGGGGVQGGPGGPGLGASVGGMQFVIQNLPPLDNTHLPATAEPPGPSQAVAASSHTSAFVMGAATQTQHVSQPNTSSFPAVYSESENYCSQLLRQGRGFPLFVPGPQTNLPAQYRTRGVAIGDVGRITAEGSFDFFFNIYLPANHPINANVPEGFVPLSPYDPIDVVPLDFDPGNYISSRTVTRTKVDDKFLKFPGGDFVFSCREPTGAVLTLPHGAHLEKLENLESMRRYAGEHAESWYKYVNVTRGRRLVNGHLYLVSGCEKAPSWGMASFHDVSLQNEFKISFGPTEDAVNGYKYRWNGAYCHYKQADSPLVEGTPLNQTTFIHAFAISVGERIWEKLFGVQVCQQVDSSTFLDKSGRSFIPYGSGGSSFMWFSFSGNGTSSGGKQCSAPPAVGNGIVTDAFPAPKAVHPSQIIHEHIFREIPRATAVITHDDDWRDVFKDDGMQTLGQTVSELQQAIFYRFEILEEDGAVFLKAKSDPITSRNTALPEGEPHPICGHIADGPHDNPNHLSQNDPYKIADEEQDQAVTFNFEEFLTSLASYDQPVEGDDPFSLVSQPNDAPTSSSHGLAIRSHSFGEQSSGHQLFLPSGGQRPRAQSDYTVLRSQTGFHLEDHDTFAVADDDLPSSNLPPMAAYLANDHWVSPQGTDSTSREPTLSPLSKSPPSPDRAQTNPLWRIRDGSDLLRHPALSLSTELLSPQFSGPASDAGSVSPSLLSPDPAQTNAGWSIRHEDNASGQLALSPTPGLLSPWRGGPGSDASSIRSSSSSPSHSHFFGPSLPRDSEFVPSSYSGGSPDPPNRDLQNDPHSQSSPLDEEPSIRGRLVQRGERRKSRHLSSIGSVARVLFEDLSLADGPSAERSHYSDRPSPYHPQSATYSLGATSSSPTEALYGYMHGAATGSASPPSNLAEGLRVPSFDVGRSRSHSTGPGLVDSTVHGDRADRSAGRGHRRRQASPYPSAGPLMNQTGSSPTEWTPESLTGQLTYDFFTRGLHPSDAQALFAKNPTPAADDAGPSSSSFSWNTGQSSQEGDHDPPAYRPSVATPATRRASNRRRKDPSKREPHVCHLCGADFTALHNLNFHIDSHLSRKNHECRECRQRFGTVQVLKRHKLKCPLVLAKKRAT